MSKIYLENGFINWSYIYDETISMCMVTGSRGTGKTYGLIKELLDRKVKFIYLRRLKTQLDECSKPDTNPFKAINNDTGRCVLPYRSGSGIRFCQSEVGEDGKYIPTDPPCALGVALSTFATVRGADFSDVDAVLFDEAISMIGEKPIKGEFEAFLNFVETVGRNRELQGRPPVKVFLLGNANRLSNPYYTGWHFMRTALKMIRGGQMMWRSQDNTRIMIMLLNSPISEQKRTTALYQNANTGFLSMALDNAFRTDETNIKSFKIGEFYHIVSCGEIGIYKHKSRRFHYVSKTISKDRYYDDYGIKLKMFQRDYQLLKVLYMDQLITFEDYDSELIFREYFELN